MTDFNELLFLKRTTMSFLRVNNFDTSHDNFSESTSIQQFRKSLNHNSIIELLKKKSKEFDKKKVSDNYKANYQKNKKCIDSHISDYEKLTDKEKYRNNMSCIYKHKHNKGLNILVYFMGETTLSSISNKYLKIISQIMIYLNCIESVIITYNEPSNQFKKELNMLNTNFPHSDDAKIFRIISYTDTNFIDLTKHSYIPKILKIYRNEEVKKFVEENKIGSIETLPRIMIDDPICKFYRCRMHDIIELERESGLSNNLIDSHIVYRHVC